MLDNVFSNKEIDDYQLGFALGRLAAQCTNLLKQAVNYYRDHGSHVFVCFIGFQKAFDNVNYWKLFNKLLDEINLDVIALWAFWYSHQRVSVSSHNVTSGNFNISNGTRHYISILFHEIH